MNDKTKINKKTLYFDLDELEDFDRITNGQNIVNFPVDLSINLIDEDPNQPRTAENPGFSPESIAELGETIKNRGVKSPISVRENKDVPGRYLINHGARRFRASIWANKRTIPSFIDNDYNEVDQFIENLQRNELTAREISDFIGRELAKGKKKSKIAKEIGKSSSFITQHVTLLNLPEPISNVFNGGLCTDVTVINELVTAYKKNPDEVTAWLADDNQELTRGFVKLLREFLEDKRSDKDSKDSNLVDAVKEEEEHDDSKEKVIQENRKIKNAIVKVKHKGQLARIILNRKPSSEGKAWIKHDSGGEEYEVDLIFVQIVALLEG